MAKKASDNLKYYHNPNGPTIGTVSRRVIEKDGLTFKDIDVENGGYMGMLAEAMECAGIPYSLTEKIFWKNADRFFRENL